MNSGQGHGCPRLTGACGERRLVSVVYSCRRATVAKKLPETLMLVTAESFQNTLNRSLLRMGLHSQGVTAWHASAKIRQWYNVVADGCTD